MGREGHINSQNLRVSRSKWFKNVKLMAKRSSATLGLAKPVRLSASGYRVRSGRNTTRSAWGRQGGVHRGLRAFSDGECSVSRRFKYHTSSERVDYLLIIPHDCAASNAWGRTLGPTYELDVVVSPEMDWFFPHLRQT